MAVAVAAFFIPQKKVEVKEIVLIALTAAAVFAILDQFTPSIGASARQGAGFGIGLNQVGWGTTQIGPDKVSCTCEVDSDVLKQKVCPAHTQTVSDSSSQVSSASNKSNASSQGAKDDKVGKGNVGIEAFDGFRKHW